MTATLLLLLKAAVGLIILAIGMDSTVKDATHLLHRPGLLVRSVLAMYVGVPLAAFALVKLLTLSPGVEIGLLVLAVSAGAPLLPRKLLRIGDGAYIFSLVLVSSVLAIVIVPAWLALLGPYFGSPLELAPTQVALILAKSFLLPLGAGMLLRWWLPAFAARLVVASDRRRRRGAHGLRAGAAGLALGCVAGRQLGRRAGPDGLVAIALAIGHALGGPAHDDRTALAVACASRHIGIAVLVAASLPGPRTAVIIAVYIVASALVSIPYLRWRRAVAPSAVFQHPAQPTLQEFNNDPFQTVAACGLVFSLIASSAFAGVVNPDCTPEKAAKSAAAKSTVGVGGRCDPKEAAKDSGKKAAGVEEKGPLEKKTSKNDTPAEKAKDAVKKP